jgi:CheY-like chemotaxis protein
MGQVILVAEDEEAIAALLQALLEDAGYRVVVAGDGRAALDQLAAQRPHLVLSDVMMPRLDGRALARAMAADPAYRAIPLVLMSAAARIRAEEVPHAAFLAKPFDLDALLATIARLLDPDDGPAA